MNCGYEIKWSYDLRSCERNFLQLRREAWKIQDFNGVWTRELAIPVRRSNQLSYEATDVGSWSFVSSNGPVRNESMMKWYIWNESYINCGYEINPVVGDVTGSNPVEVLGPVVRKRINLIQD